MQRRTFLVGAGVAGLAGLAGCQTAVGAVAPPQVPTIALAENGWEQQSGSTDETVFEETYGPLTVEAVASSVAYRNVALAASVREDTLGAVGGPLALFSATRIDLAPAVDELGPIRNEVRAQIDAMAREGIREELAAAGLTDVRETGTDTIRVDGQEASLTEFEAVYGVADIAFPIQSGRSLSIPGTDLPVTALLAVWAANGSYLVAGGAFPAANFATRTTTELSDAITVSVDVDLGLTPTDYRTELEGLITAVR